MPAHLLIQLVENSQKRYTLLSLTSPLQRIRLFYSVSLQQKFGAAECPASSIAADLGNAQKTYQGLLRLIDQDCLISSTNQSFRNMSFLGTHGHSVKVLRFWYSVKYSLSVFH